MVELVRQGLLTEGGLRLLAICGDRGALLVLGWRTEEDLGSLYADSLRGDQEWVRAVLALDMETRKPVVLGLYELDLRERGWGEELDVRASVRLRREQRWTWTGMAVYPMALMINEREAGDVVEIQVLVEGDRRFSIYLRPRHRRQQRAVIEQQIRARSPVTG